MVSFYLLALEEAKVHIIKVQSLYPHLEHSNGRRLVILYTLLLISVTAKTQLHAIMRRALLSLLINGLINEPGEGASSLWRYISAHLTLLLP